MWKDVRLWSHVVSMATNQSYGQNGCSTTTPLPERGCFRKSGIRTFNDELQTEDPVQKRYKCICERVSEWVWERERGGRKRERQMEIGDDWVNKTPCGTSTMGVFEYSGDIEIGLKLKIELSSLLPTVLALKFTLWTFHIPATHRDTFRSCLFVAKGMMSLFSFDGHWKLLEDNDGRQTLRSLPSVILFSLHLRSQSNDHGGDQNPFDGIFKSNRILLYLRTWSRHAENLQRGKFVRELSSNDGKVRQ